MLSACKRFFTGTQGMAIAAIALGVSVFLSRILGLVRDKVISFYFGASLEADVYFMAFVVPDFLNYLLAGGYFSITLIPLLAQNFAKSEENGWEFFSSAVCWAALAIAALTLIAWLCTPWLAPLLAPDFPAEAQQRLSFFLRIILPAQVCFLPGACFTALLYHRRQFAVPALTPLVYNGCIILGGMLFLYAFPGRGMEGFCWGVLAGAALGSLCLPLLAAKQGGLSFFPRLRHPDMRTVLFLALPLMLGQSIVALDEQFVRIFGSLTGEGGVSLLNYARRIMLVPVGVVAQAAGLAAYPFLAALAAKRAHDEFGQSLNGALGNTLLIALPLSLWMLVAAEPTMRLIFQQGSFSSQDASSSGILLAIMLSGVAFWAVQQILGRAFYAYQDTLTPALAGTAATVAALPLYWLGARFAGAPGVALAGTAGVAAYTLLLCVVWQRKHGPLALSGIVATALRCFAYCLPACALAYAACFGIDLFLSAESLGSAFCKIAASGIVFAAVYLCLTHFFAPALCAPVLDFCARIRRKLWKKA